MDIFSSEYGWETDYILDNIHIGDLLGFTDAIQRRKKGEALLRLAIVQNPYTKDPNTLFKELQSDGGYSVSGSKMDRKSMEDLKKKLSNKSKFVKVKNGKTGGNNS